LIFIFIRNIYRYNCFFFLNRKLNPDFEWTAWNCLYECIKVQISSLSNQVTSSTFNSHVSIGEIYVFMVLENSISDVTTHIVNFHSSIEKNFVTHWKDSRVEHLKILHEYDLPSLLKMTVCYIWSPTYSLISHHLLHCHFIKSRTKNKKKYYLNLFSQRKTT